MQVREIMVQPVITALENATLEEVAQIMAERRVGSVPIVNGGGQLVGLITMSDFAPPGVGGSRGTFRAVEHFRDWLAKGSAAAVFAEKKSLAASAVMTNPVITVGEDDSLETAVNRMLEEGLHRLIITRDGAPVGVISQTDLLRLMYRGVR